MTGYKSSCMNVCVFVGKIGDSVFVPLTINGFFASSAAISTSRELIGVKSRFAGPAVSAVVTRFGIETAIATTA